jgi:hypothetical protein
MENMAMVMDTVTDMAMATVTKKEKKKNSSF